jgi:hypothetical protein
MKGMIVAGFGCRIVWFVGKMDVDEQVKDFIGEMSSFPGGTNFTCG